VATLAAAREYLAAVELFDKDHDARPFQTAWNVRKLLDVRPFFAPQGRRRAPSPASFLTVPKQETVDGWLHALPQRAKDADRAHRLTEALYRSLEAEDARRRSRSRISTRRSATSRCVTGR